MSKAQKKPAFINKAEVMRRLGIGETKLREMIKRGILPPGVTLTDGGRALYWIDTEIDALQATRLALREAGPVPLPPTPPLPRKRDDRGAAE